jgi:PAS domain-containing protein
MIHSALHYDRAGASAPSARNHHQAVADGVREATGTMRLTAVREAGRIVDFQWQAANAAAARLMRCKPHELCGKGLLDVIAGPMDHPALIDLYRRVLEHGNAQSFAQVHRVDGWHDVVLHCVVRSGDGVTVTLTNQSALRRELAARTGLSPPPRKPQ